MTNNKTSGGKGTNQYAVKGTAKIKPPKPKGGLFGAFVVEDGRYVNRPGQPSVAPPSPPIPTSATVGMAYDPNDPDCHPDFLLEAADDPQYHWAIIQNPNSPPEALQIVFDTTPPDMRHYVQSNPNCPPAVLASLATDDSSIIRAALVEDTRLSDDLIRLLARDSNNDVKRHVAWRAACPPDVLDQLTADPNAWVREEMAKRTDHTPQRWTALAADREPTVRRRIAGNPACPTEIQDRLAKDKIGQVRVWIANRPDNPPERMATLAADKQSTVRQVVARNPHCPANVLEKLSTDSNQAVRDAVLTNPSRPAKIPIQGQPLRRATLLSIAQNPNTTTDQLHEIVTTGIHDQDLAAVIFFHDNAGVADQVALFGAILPMFRRQAVDQPDCPPEILAVGARWNEPGIREASLQHPYCPAEPLTEWAGRSGRSACLALRHPNCPPEALVRAMQTGSMEMRQAALHNPNCPDHIRAIIALGAYD